MSLLEKLLGRREMPNAALEYCTEETRDTSSCRFINVGRIGEDCTLIYCGSEILRLYGYTPDFEEIVKFDAEVVDCERENGGSAFMTEKTWGVFERYVAILF